MAVVTRTFVAVDGNTLTAAIWNNEFNNLLNALALTNADIASGAAIAQSKLNLGISGNIVGDSDTQTLTNKTLTSPILTTPSSSAPLKLSAGNQETGRVGWDATAASGGQQYGVGANFKTVMTNTPSSISLTNVVVSNIGSATISNIDQYGFRVTAISSGGGTIAGHYTYVTVGN